MSSKNKGSLLRHELSYGIVAKWYKYLPLALISGSFCFILYSDLRFVTSVNNTNIIPSTMDYLLYLFKGMHIYVPSPDNPFEIPIIWLIPNLFIAFTVANYPTHDLSGFGKYIMIQSRNRVRWYLNKCVWIISNVFVCFLMIYLAPLLLSAFTGNFSFQATGGETMAGYLEADYSAVDSAALLRSVILLPLFTSLALSFVQILLEFLLRPIYSFTIVACVLVASAYLYTPVLIGNISILLRSEFAIEDGIHFAAGMIINICIIVTAVVAGCLYFKKYDILDND